MAANFDRSDILRTAQTFMDQGDVWEMRIPKAGRFKTISGYYDDTQNFADSIIGLADEGFPGFYFTANPVQPDLFARSANKYEKYAQNTTTDGDITRRRWLLVDLDPIRPAGISSSNTEHAAALRMAGEIRTWLISRGWPANAFILADSGNGGHLAAKIDLPNDEESKKLIENCLKALDFIFSDDKIKVDCTTFNAARIWKIYGTMARKGSDTPDRPHRLSKLLEVPDSQETITKEQLEALAAILPKVDPIKSNGNGQTFDPAKYAQEHGANVLRTKSWQGWELAILEECPFDPSHNRGEACIMVHQSGAKKFSCKHDSCKGNDWQSLKKRWGSPEETDTRQKAEEAAKKFFECIDSEELTEGGNAKRLERLHGEDLRYNHTHKKWYLWDIGRWKVDGNGGAMRLAGNVVASLYLNAANADGKDERAVWAEFAAGSDSRKGLSNMLALAANRLKFARTADDFDRNAWLLGAGDLTFDLKTCTTREPQREDLITKTIGTNYDRAAPWPLWDAFLTKIFPDLAVRNYIKRAVGYCLTGSMIEQVFFFCYGKGANGKSVFLAILRALLGEYAKQADFSTFLVQRNEKVRNDLAALAGARVITATEAEEGGRLSMQVIKSWTGADPITARFLFGEYFTFHPTGKIWLAANNKPAITERNHAAWRRVRLIPFNVTIPESEQDKNLEAKLLQELSGILNWALEGLQDYLQNGLDTPKAVQTATNEYRKENDNLEQFVLECCDLGKLKVCKNSDLFGQYINFCRMSGLKPLSQKTFSLELSTRDGVTSTRSKHGIEWKGIALKSGWCRVETNPTSITEDSKDVGLSQNAQPSLNSPTRGDFAHLTNDPTPHSDYNPTPPYTKPKTEDKTGFEEFKRNKAKRKCCLCGRTFPHDLTPYYNNGVSGYICVSCHMGGKPPEPIKSDAQTKLSHMASAN